MPKLLVVAGEPSGDLHGANLIEELKKLTPGVEVFGIGGDRMRNVGVELIHNSRDLSLIGFLEVIHHLPSLRRVMRDLFYSMVEREPDLVLLIDSPGFNLRFARVAKLRGYRVLYYIAPQVWAWGKWRMRTMAKSVNRVIVTLPFEERLWQDFGIDTSFVGHPLLDVVERHLSRDEFCLEFGIQPELPIVGLLPGSREEEVERILPLMLLSIRNLPDFNYLLPLAPEVRGSKVERMAKRIFPGVKIVEGVTYEVMGSADLLLVASGTATLEACILGTPMLIVYKVSPPSWLIGKALVKTPHIGLVNILAGREVCPEFVQFSAKPEGLSSAILNLLREGRAPMVAELREVRQLLGERGAAEKAARIVMRELAL